MLSVNHLLPSIHQKISTNIRGGKHYFRPLKATQFLTWTALTALAFPTILVTPRYFLILLRKTVSILDKEETSDREKTDQNSTRIKSVTSRSLHTIGALIKLDCGSLEIGDWQKTTGEIIEQNNTQKDLQRLILDKKIKKAGKSTKKLSSSSLNKNLEKRCSSTESTSFGSSDSSSDVSITHKVRVLKQVGFVEINDYLEQLKDGKDFPVNGVLSRALNGFLQQLRSHLKAKTCSYLQTLHEQEAKEVYDHLLLGAAGLELIIQAIHDQRFSHIALGFRSVLIHCHYAIEQALDHLVMLKTNTLLDTREENHDLAGLAEKAQITDLKKWEEFLKEITLHLAFSYPIDHQIFFQKNSKLKAVSLLEDLSRINVSTEKIEEAVKFCFEMYLKSISFIIEASSAQIKDQEELTLIIYDLEKTLIQRLHLLCIVESIQIKETAEPLTERIDKALSYLGPLDTYSYVKNRKIYAALGAIHSYLQLMKISVEIPQASSKHSLQRFIKIETIAHIDKLFKQLFRATILIQGGQDIHHHDLIKLFDLINIHNKDSKNLEKIKYQLKEINLATGHHYLHTRKNKNTLKVLYNKLLKQAHILISAQDDVSLSEEGYSVGRRFWQFTKNVNEILDLVLKSFNLFLDFLEPTLSEIKKNNMPNIEIF